MYHSKIDQSNPRKARLRTYGIADPNDRLHYQLSDVLSAEAATTAGIYVDQYLRITGINLDAAARQNYVDEVNRHLVTKYRPPFDETWIAQCEKIAELIYSSHTDPAAHLGALSVSQQHELRIIFKSAKTVDEGLRLVSELSRFYSLDAEIMLTTVQQCHDREHGEWITRQIEVFRRVVTEAVEQAAAKSADGKRQADQSSDLMQTLLALADEVAGASQESAQAMGDAALTAGGLRITLDDMSDVLCRASKALSEATNTVEETQSTVEDLTSQNASIQSIAELIQSITSKTSILALNARIEAARAGEAGYGFAVVASEIKGLSEQTAQATEEIVARLRKIEQASERAIAANQSMQDTFTQARDMTEAVCQEVTEQTTTVTKIAASVDETSLSAVSSSDAIQQIRELVGGITDEMHSANGLADDLNQQISDLKTGADDFLQSLSVQTAAARVQPHADQTKPIAHDPSRTDSGVQRDALGPLARKQGEGSGQTTPDRALVEVESELDADFASWLESD